MSPCYTKQRIEAYNAFDIQILTAQGDLYITEQCYPQKTAASQQMVASSSMFFTEGILSNPGDKLRCLFTMPTRLYYAYHAVLSLLCLLRCTMCSHCCKGTDMAVGAPWQQPCF